MRFSVTFTGSLQRWDTNLKLVAEGYAAKCVWNHNPELEETGENLYAGTGPLDLRSALEKWFMGESSHKSMLVGFLLQHGASDNVSDELINKWST